MGNRTAKFISALAGSIIAGAPLAAVSQNAPTATNTASAASDCLASPKGVAPQGQHWFYRLERSTKRQCWYLRAEGGKDGAKDNIKDNSKTAQAAAEMPAADPTPPPSVKNARAEYIAPQAASAPPPAQPAPAAADSSPQQPAVTARWPDAAAAPAPQAITSPAPATPQPGAKPAKSPAPVTLAAAEAPADKPTGSLQTLLLVIVGALALAGLSASVIYRFAGGRVRVQASDQRRVNWGNRESDNSDHLAPWLDAAPTAASRAQPPRPVDFDATRPQAAQLTAFTREIGRIAAQSRSVPIEATEPDEAEIETFDGEFEIEAPAPQLAADDVHDEAPADRDDTAHDADDVDIDVITAMLERLAKEGPRLTEPSLEADLGDFVRSPRGQSAARA